MAGAGIHELALGIGIASAEKIGPAHLQPHPDHIRLGNEDAAETVDGAVIGRVMHVEQAEQELNLIGPCQPCRGGLLQRQQQPPRVLKAVLRQPHLGRQQIIHPRHGAGWRGCGSGRGLGPRGRNSGRDKGQDRGWLWQGCGKRVGSHGQRSLCGKETSQ